MKFVGEVGGIVLQTQKSTIEWNVGHFLSLSDKVDDYYDSPVFSFAGSRWYLEMFPNGRKEHSSEVWVGLYLIREGEKPPQTVHFTFDYRGSSFSKTELTHEFTTDVGYGFSNCWTREKFNDHETTIICHLRSDGVFIPQTLPEEEVETLRQQIKNLEKTIENYELESENYKKQISTSEIEKSSLEEKYSCLQEEKNTTISELEKENALSEKEVETLRERIKNFEKTIENYELESENYKKQISVSEIEKSSLEEKYSCLQEEKNTTVSVLEKDNDLLRNKIESLMERIEILQKATEKYELESEKYQKQISASGNEKAHIEETYKCLLEEHSNVVSDNDRLQNKMESLMERIQILEKATENYELESENYRKQISVSESEKSSLEEKYKCLLEGNSIIVARLKNALCFVALFFVLFEILVFL